MGSSILPLWFPLSYLNSDSEMQRNHQELKKNSGRVKPHPKREREIKNTKKNIALSSARENAGIILS